MIFICPISPYLILLKHIKIFKDGNGSVLSQKIVFPVAFVLSYFHAVAVRKIGKRVKKSTPI